MTKIQLSKGYFSKIFFPLVLPLWCRSWPQLIKSAVVHLSPRWHCGAGRNFTWAPRSLCPRCSCMDPVSRNEYIKQNRPPLCTVDDKRDSETRLMASNNKNPNDCHLSFSKMKHNGALSTKLFCLECHRALLYFGEEEKEKQRKGWWPSAWFEREKVLTL